MGLIGRHQRDTAVTAAGAALALRQQGFSNISVPSILAGLSKARLPGRFQVGAGHMFRMMLICHIDRR